VEGGSEIKTTLGKKKAKEGKTNKVDFHSSAPHAWSISIALAGGIVLVTIGAKHKP
jgi:hypothetical protein